MSAVIEIDQVQMMVNALAKAQHKVDRTVLLNKLFNNMRKVYDERDRYKKALEEIAYTDRNCTWPEELIRVIEIAEQALAGEKQKEE
jgi:hypothetical protein